MVITAENLEKIENLIPLWNHYCDIHGIEDHVYDMGELDDELFDMKATDIIDRLCEFDVRNDYFYWNNGWLCSGNKVDIIDNVIDFESLAKDISKKPDEYRDRMEAEEFAEILLYSTDLGEVEWEDLLVVYTAEDIGRVRNWTLAKSDIKALNKLKEENPDMDYLDDIDDLLGNCREK